MAKYNISRVMASSNKKPFVTLFMLQSLDGKISSGSTDSMDADSDFSRIKGVKEGLPQYYDLEKETDEWSLNTGRVMEKIGVNSPSFKRDKIPVLKFVIIDNKPHLNETGLRNLCNWVGELYIVTTNMKHPAWDLRDELSNLTVLFYDKLDLDRLLKDLYGLGCDRLTLQSGGTMNGKFVREKLINRVSIVIAPLIVGGKDVPTLVDGDSLTSSDELYKLMVLKLTRSKPLKNSYLWLEYDVVS